jgi:hypothetical protein
MMISRDQWEAIQAFIDLVLRLARTNHLFDIINHSDMYKALHSHACEPIQIGLDCLSEMR